MDVVNTDVEVVKTGPTGHIERAAVKAFITGEMVMLPIGTDVDEGDRIEYLQGTKPRTLMLTKIDYLESPFGTSDLDHIEATYTVSQTRPPVPLPPVTIAGLHPRVSTAAAALLAGGHPEQAVFEAFRAVEDRVQQLTAGGGSGQGLMSSTFAGQPPLLDVTKTTGRNARDEQEGFKFLFMGASTALRNPRGHGSAVSDTPDETLEYLAVASMLMRRLDLAAERQDR